MYCHIEDEEAITYLFQDELKDREQNSFQGIGSTLQILTHLIRKYNADDKYADLLKRAKNANFDCACGYDPDRMRAAFTFEDGVTINGESAGSYVCGENPVAERFFVEKGETRLSVLVLSRRLADSMFLISGERLVFTDAALLEDEKGLRLETTSPLNEVMTYPADVFAGMKRAARRDDPALPAFLGCYQFETKERRISTAVNQVGRNRYTIVLPEEFMKGLKDARLRMDYSGDIGNAFIDGRLIHDNFCDGGEK